MNNQENEENSSRSSSGSRFFREQHRKLLKKQYAKNYRFLQKQQEKKNGQAGIDYSNPQSIPRSILKSMFGRKPKQKKSLKLLLAAGVLLLLFIILFTSAFAVAGEAVVNAVMQDSYLSDPAELDAADLLYSRKEMDLQETIDEIETANPGYDEYDYNLGAIGHDPFTLLNYLSAVYTQFTIDQVENEINTLFNKAYKLTLTPATETQTRTVETKDESGETVQAEESYEVKILRVTLKVVSLESICQAGMTDEQKSIAALYEESKGNLQQYSSPVDLYWYLYITSYYGYRKNPTTDQKELHRGVDLAIPSGTKVYSGQDGTVTKTGSDDYYGKYIVIANESGFESRYAHLKSLTVRKGQTVAAGDQIGLSGDTGSSIGSELHFECLFNGEYYNPLLYFSAGTKTLYGEEATGTSPTVSMSGSAGTGGTTAAGTGGTSGTGSSLAPGSYDEEKVQKLMAEAVKYLGYPYVWGGSSPSTSFDCSGFVCWCYTHGAGYDLPRMKAQSIFNKCTVVSASEARPGDLVFFTGTYKASYPVTHIAIYCGNNTIIHAGDPIQYSKITGYYQKHFYAFGRLPGW